MEHDSYKEVSLLFSKKIEDIFSTEGALEGFFKDNFPQLIFDRTENWDILLLNLFQSCWKETPPGKIAKAVPYDIIMSLKCILDLKLLDFNLYTQVYANLYPPVYMKLDRLGSTKKLKDLAVKYKDAELSPFAKKAKQVKQENLSEGEKNFNFDLSFIKAADIIAKAKLNNSWRVSPKGSTPSFTDSNNISRVGAGGEEFIVPIDENFTKINFYWTSPELILNELDGTEVKASGIGYTFTPSSLDLLNTFLFSRKLAYGILSILSNEQFLNSYLLIKMYSISVFCKKEYEESIREKIKELTEKFLKADFVI